MQVKREDKEGYAALQLGCGSKRLKQLNGAEIGHFSAAGVPNKRKLQEFRISQVGLASPRLLEPQRDASPACMPQQAPSRRRAQCQVGGPSGAL